MVADIRQFHTDRINLGPFDSSDPDIFLDLDFTTGKAAIDAILVTTEGFTENGSGGTWDSELGWNPNGSHNYSRVNWTPSAVGALADVQEETTIYMEVEREAFGVIWLDDPTVYTDSNKGPSASAWNGSAIVPANHLYGDYTAGVKQGYALFVGGNAAGTPFFGAYYQVLENPGGSGKPQGRAVFNAKDSVGIAGKTIRFNANPSGAERNNRFMRIVFTVDKFSILTIYIDGRPIHRELRSSSLSADNMFYYCTIGSRSTTGNTIRGYIKRIQFLKRSVNGTSKLKAPSVAFIGDSFTVRATNMGTPAGFPNPTVAAIDAVNHWTDMGYLYSGIAGENPVEAFWENWGFSLQKAAINSYGFGFPMYCAAAGGQGWSNTGAGGGIQIRQAYFDAVVKYDPEIVVCVGCTNDVNPTLPPTDLVAEIKDRLDYLITNSRNIRKIFFCQTFPGHKGTNQSEAWITEYERQVGLQRQLDGYSNTNLKGETISVKFVETYDVMGRRDYDPNFNWGSSQWIQDFDSVNGTTYYQDEVHPQQLGQYTMARLVWNAIKPYMLGIATEP